MAALERLPRRAKSTSKRLARFTPRTTSLGAQTSKRPRRFCRSSPGKRAQPLSQPQRSSHLEQETVWVHVDNERLAGRIDAKIEAGIAAQHAGSSRPAPTS